MAQDKELKDKAISFKGKSYVLVADRIIFFNEVYPNGSIETVETTENGSKMVKFRAVITPDASKPERKFTGHSQAIWGQGYINQTSALENAETSAVGRALSMMGIGVIDSVASFDEIKKSQNNVVPVDEYQSQEAHEYMRTVDEAPLKPTIDGGMQEPLEMDSGLCPVHSVPLREAVSKKTNKPYFYHKSDEGDICFGKGYKTSAYHN